MMTKNEGLCRDFKPVSCLGVRQNGLRTGVSELCQRDAAESVRWSSRTKVGRDYLRIEMCWAHSWDSPKEFLPCHNFGVKCKLDFMLFLIRKS